MENNGFKLLIKKRIYLYMEWETINYKGGRSKMNRPVGKILEEDSYTCALCSGKGILHGTKNSKCPVCSGKGKINIQGPVVACAFCKGSGAYPPRTNSTCSCCRGKGLISVKPPIETCPTCKGRGKAPGSSLSCMKCRGAGVVTKKD
jgi:DnaJ-class molecular chaperone